MSEKSWWFIDSYRCSIQWFSRNLSGSHFSPYLRSTLTGWFPDAFLPLRWNWPQRILSSTGRPLFSEAPRVASFDILSTDYQPKLRHKLTQADLKLASLRLEDEKANRNKVLSGSSCQWFSWYTFSTISISRPTTPSRDGLWATVIALLFRAKSASGGKAFKCLVCRPYVAGHKRKASYIRWLAICSKWTTALVWLSFETLRVLTLGL